ncbi:HWE histidine kinase domain-containing protein [Aestuariibius insulae]|uniref:HWE histidine kinase domain-containing protein n=1 Tax=Aestuariibius insulae TaxID=2058287 RepID=UPI00345E5E6A
MALMPQHDPQTRQPIDLTNCDREPIHILGNVQPFGCLIAVSRDWIVTHLSTNAKNMIGLDPEHVIGTPIADHLPKDVLHSLRSRLQIAAYSETPSRLFNVKALGDDRLFDIAAHQSGTNWVIELEPKGEIETTPDGVWSVQPLVARLRRHDSIKRLAMEGAQAIRAMSGFDRVMVYQFNEDHSGSVIAEIKQPGMEPYLGLRYPATDIPKQAREMYKRSVLRLIADVDAEVSPIVPELNAEGQPLDLSLSVTRAVSPIHLEYLRNMGVQASMSVSILKDGELWGLFACHHRTPRVVDYEKRTMIELYAQLFNYEIALKDSEQSRQEAEDAKELHDRLMTRAADHHGFAKNFEIISEEIRQVIPFDGIIFYSDDRIMRLGSTPDDDQFMALIRFLNTTAASNVFASEALSERHPPAADYANEVAGVMALPISRHPRDYIVLFRREVAQSVKWAGNPEKPVEAGPNGARLTPRKSFEAWQQIVKGQSTPWTKSERNAAEALRITLIEVVLKLSDAAAIARKQSADKQDLLIAELNHRVRNILNLIQGLVRQGRDDALSTEAYTRELGGRIHALARAHDLITAENWSPTSVKELVELEVAAFLSDKADRLHLDGDDVLLAPEAMTTIALVIHELVTNSTKHGALSNETGVINLDLSRDDRKALVVDWTETGGPAVTAPSRRGFGSTIIERSIPFELKGEAELNYRLTGLHARFVIPERYVSDAKVQRKETLEIVTSDTEDGPVPSHVLVVEDNMIIALDVTDSLTELGVEASQVASSVTEALSLLDKEAFDLALLDVNLGAETSIQIAERLQKDGIPFILATGYGGANELARRYPDAPILSKPFGSDKLKQAMTRILLEK